MTKLPSSSPDVRDDENPLGRILGLAAAALGVLTLLLGFAPLAGSSAYKGSTSFYGIGGLPAMMLVLLLAGGLLAAAGSVPKLTSYTPVAAVLVVAGFLGLLVSVIAVAGVSGVGLGFGAYIVLLFALLLVVATVGALLIEVGIITPQQRPAQSGAGEHYGQPGTSPYGPGANPGPFGAPQQGGYGARAAPQGQGFPQQGPGRYGPPAQQQYGQPQQQPQHRTAAPYQQAASYQQPPQPDRPEAGGPTADEQARSYQPPTQSFGPYAAEGERPRDTPYGPPPQQ